MTTKELRTAVKDFDPRGTVSGAESDGWTIKTTDIVSARALCEAQGLKIIYNDIEGSRYNWRHSLWVTHGVYAEGL